MYEKKEKEKRLLEKKLGREQRWQIRMCYEAAEGLIRHWRKVGRIELNTNIVSDSSVPKMTYLLAFQHFH